MDAGMQEMREILIELRLNMQHLSANVSTTLGQFNDQQAKLEKTLSDYQRRTDERLYNAEKNIWIAVGIASAIATALPYIMKAILER